MSTASVPLVIGGIGVLQLSRTELNEQRHPPIPQKHRYLTTQFDYTPWHGSRPLHCKVRHAIGTGLYEFFVGTGSGNKFFVCDDGCQDGWLDCHATIEDHHVAIDFRNLLHSACDKLAEKITP